MNSTDETPRLPIPLRLLRNPYLPPAALRLYLLLQLLAGGEPCTPPLSNADLAALSGYSRTALQTNLRLLLAFQAVSVQAAPNRKKQYAFLPDPAAAEPANAESRISGNQPDRILNENQDSKRIKNIESLKDGEPSENRISGNPPPAANSPAGGASLPPDPPPADAAAIFRQVFRFSLTADQRRRLSQETIELALWQRTLEHWRDHGWNPRNLPGMLELYARGGPTACRYCQPEPRHKPASQKQERSLQALDSLRRQG